MHERIIITVLFCTCASTCTLCCCRSFHVFPVAVASSSSLKLRCHDALSTQEKLISQMDSAAGPRKRPREAGDGEPGNEAAQGKKPRTSKGEGKGKNGRREKKEKDTKDKKAEKKDAREKKSQKKTKKDKDKDSGKTARRKSTKSKAEDVGDEESKDSILDAISEAESIDKIFS